jgi:hypothetical protein
MNYFIPTGNRKRLCVELTESTITRPSSTITEHYEEYANTVENIPNTKEQIQRKILELQLSLELCTDTIQRRKLKNNIYYCNSILVAIMDRTNGIYCKQKELLEQIDKM